MPKSHTFLGNHGASCVIIGCISQLFPGQDCNYHITPNRPMFISDALSYQSCYYSTLITG